MLRHPVDSRKNPIIKVRFFYNYFIEEIHLTKWNQIFKINSSAIIKIIIYDYQKDIILLIINWTIYV